MRDMEKENRNSIQNGQTVGIIADSHGRPHTIENAIDFLKNYGCCNIYHLGDICDSFLPETSGTCVRLLHENGVAAVKGNNDHAIVINHGNQAEVVVSQKTLDYLQNLPPTVEYEGAVFTHSLPFVQELGLSSMIGVMRKEWAKRFFLKFPQGILFRGHGHNPEIKWQQNNRIISETISPGQQVDLAKRLPCVVTCGALTQGLCMVWNPNENVLICDSFI